MAAASLMLGVICLQLVVSSAGTVNTSKKQFEAAFQGECGAPAAKRGGQGPCQQLCFDLHDGTFECGCRQGYKLNEDGYSCALDSLLNGTSGGSSGLVNGSAVATNATGNETGNATSSSNVTTAYSPLFDFMLGDQPAAETRRAGNDESNKIDVFYRDETDASETLNTVSPVTTAAASATSSEDEDSDTEEEGDEGSFWACDELKCLNGGFCIPVALGDANLVNGVRCSCPLGFSGPFCDETVSDIKYPSFMGTSYLSLPVLRDAHKSMQITMEFRPLANNAVLLYSGELPTLQGDFFAVLLVEGFVEFRFDCGMGEGRLRSDQPIVLGAWNKLTIFRDRWDAWMQLNGGHQVQGRSKGLFSRITFRQNLIVGGSRNMTEVVDRIGLRSGFIGCLRRLEVNSRSFDFGFGSRGDAIDGVDIEECSSDVCNSVMCENGGQCVDSEKGAAGSCLCPLGFTGERCEQEVNVLVPSFNGTSYLRYPGLGEKALSYVDVQIVLKPTAVNGLFFYNGHQLDGHGDFIALQLIDGFVEFRFDLGNGPAIIRSKQALTMDEWHTVTVSRTGRQGILRVDDHPIIIGHSPGAFTQLSLPLNLYIGGVADIEETSLNAAISESFSGCIQKVTINNKPLRLLQEALSGFSIANCAHPCVTAPCFNGGQCEPTMETYACHCKLGYAGSQCETEVHEAIAQPMMGGQSYLHYTSDEILKRVRGTKIDIQMRFRSFSGHGLLLWAGEQDVSAESDFVSLGINRGELVFRFNLGSGEGTIRYNYTRVDDGRWHTLRAIRYRQEGSLTVDDGPTLIGTSFGTLHQLSVNSGLYIGGIREVAHMTFNRYTTGLVGCIGNFTLSTDYHVRLVTHATTGINVQPCI